MTIVITTMLYFPL